MALKTCTECGKQVSSAAKTCPNCGVKNPTKIKEGPIIRIITKFFGLICIGILFYFVYVVVGYYSEEKENQKIEMQREVKNWINNSEDIKENKLVCKTVNLIKESRNKYSGYAMFNNGDQADVNVTIDADEYLMKTDISSVIIRERERILNESVLICGVVIEQIPEKNILLVRILSSTDARNIPENDSQRSLLVETIFNTALTNHILSDTVEAGIITFPADSEELQREEDEYFLMTVVKDGQYEYIDTNGEKRTINKYKFLESYLSMEENVK